MHDEFVAAGLKLFQHLCRPHPADRSGSWVYQGFEGGLYPQGSNQPPSTHLAAGLAFAQQIVPLDSAGNPDPANGKYVLLSIGMSNATQEFQEFVKLADTDADRNSRLVVVDGAQGG